MRLGQESQILNISNTDSQIKNPIGVLAQADIFDTLSESIWQKVEEASNEKLIPTYGYARVYRNGNILKYHNDRPSCEVSVTIQLAKSHSYTWPIFVEGKRYDLEEGDGVLYYGCDQYHWRNMCEGPPDYYSGQIFLHYVRENGKYKEFGGDKRWEKLPFKKNRLIQR
jgi:hypothetical protein